MFNKRQSRLQNFISRILNGEMDFESEIIDGKIFIFWPDGSRVYFSSTEWDFILDQAKVDMNFHGILEVIWSSAEGKEDD
tara:strand:+ start:1962 stop:2201 length:240 start_codon:yes stop_codon:yes gene_type:complete